MQLSPSLESVRGSAVASNPWKWDRHDMMLLGRCPHDPTPRVANAPRVACSWSLFRCLVCWLAAAKRHPKRAVSRMFRPCSPLFFTTFFSWIIFIHQFSIVCPSSQEPLLSSHSLSYIMRPPTSDSGAGNRRPLVDPRSGSLHCFPCWSIPMITISSPSMPWSNDAPAPGSASMTRAH